MFNQHSLLKKAIIDFNDTLLMFKIQSVNLIDLCVFFDTKIKFKEHINKIKNIIIYRLENMNNFYANTCMCHYSDLDNIHPNWKFILCTI